MSSKTKKLGALADIYQSQNLDGTITRIKLARIKPSSDQPRRDRTLAIQELAASLARDGLLSPILVTKDGEGYRIIAGERRYHAMKQLGWIEAECRIVSREERDYWRLAIIENLQREDLSAEEEAIALLKLKRQESLSDSTLAELVGKSRNYITEILGIGQLPDQALQECRRLGLDNKNFLIQAVQAHKREALRDFLQACADGRIRTVRDARQFNQEEPLAGAGQPEDGNPEKTRTRAASIGSGDAGTDAEIRLAVKGSDVLVSCPDARTARRIKSHLQRSMREILS